MEKFKKQKCLLRVKKTLKLLLNIYRVMKKLESPELLNIYRVMKKWKNCWLLNAYYRQEKIKSTYIVEYIPGNKNIENSKIIEYILSAKKILEPINCWIYHERWKYWNQIVEYTGWLTTFASVFLPQIKRVYSIFKIEELLISKI